MNIEANDSIQSALLQLLALSFMVNYCIYEPRFYRTDLGKIVYVFFYYYYLTLDD